MLKIVDTSLKVAPLQPSMGAPENGEAGQSLILQAHANSNEPILRYHWNLGDGVSLDGAQIGHAYTHAGSYRVSLTTIGLNGLTAERHFTLTIKGNVVTKFVPSQKVRYQPVPLQLSNYP
jgi:hypothetical protein